MLYILTNFSLPKTISTNAKNDSAFKLWPKAVHCTIDQMARTTCTPRSGWQRGTYCRDVMLSSGRGSGTKLNMGKEKQLTIAFFPAGSPK